MENEKLSFDAYLMERKHNSYEKACWIEIKQGTEKIILTTAETYKLKDILTELLLVAFPPNEGYEKKKKYTPYSGKWLQSEMAKLLRSEKYEEAEDLRKVIEIVKQHEKQTKLEA